jgi:hypothetical protein
MQKQPITRRFLASLNTRSFNLVLDRIPITCTSLQSSEVSTSNLSRGAIGVQPNHTHRIFAISWSSGREVLRAST